MLSTAALFAATTRMTQSCLVLSPSKTSRVRVFDTTNTTNQTTTTNKYRYDPYACRVLTSPMKLLAIASPVRGDAAKNHQQQYQQQSAVAANINVNMPPAANRSLLDILKQSAPTPLPQHQQQTFTPYPQYHQQQQQLYGGAPPPVVMMQPTVTAAAITHYSQPKYTLPSSTPAAAAPLPQTTNTNVTTATPAATVVASGTAPADGSTTGVCTTNAPRYASIRFKHGAGTFLAPFRVAIGDMVVVEGDRGEDLGNVESITTDKPAFPVPLRIVRKATQADRTALLAKRQKEEEALRSAQSLADSVGLPVQIADCEFQFDYNKLTVFFRSKSRHIDFRKLQRGLFREFRCRIWLTEAFKHIAGETNPLA